MALRWFVLTTALAAAACGTDDTSRGVGPEVPDFVLGGGEQDADGMTDGGGIITTDDAGADVGTDAAPTTDTVAPEDTGAPAVDVSEPDLGDLVCEPGSTACEGQVLLTCSADGMAVGRTRCAAREAFCEEAPDGAQCSPRACEPGVWACISTDESAPCDDVGAGYAAPTACEEGCDRDTGRCAEAVPECAADLTAIEPGEYVFDLCETGGDFAHVEQRDCGTGGAESGRDLLFSFSLREPAEVLVDLRDEDDNAAIDTIVYLRSACLDPASQIDCSDDIPCDESDVEFGDCSGGVQVRQSRIRTRLEAGTYFIVADHLSYRGFDCGQVRLLLDY